MLMARPSIAVAIPLYNHARFLRAALGSVLAQTSPLDEIIVVDDGSSDGGADIAEAALLGRTGAVVMRQENAGAHAALNRAVESAGSDFIAVLNSDDMFAPDKIARCRRLLETRPGLQLIFGGVELVDAAGAPVRAGETADWLARARAFYHRTGDLVLSLINENFAATTSNMVFSRAVWRRVGGFQPLRVCHDLDFLLAVATHGGIFFDADSAHVLYRLHSRNTIKEDKSREREELAAVFAATRAWPCGAEALEAAALRQVLAQKGLLERTEHFTRLAVGFPNRGAFYQGVVGADAWRKKPRGQPR